jgi:hypothetical protein
MEFSANDNMIIYTTISDRPNKTYIHVLDMLGLGFAKPLL